jgi:phosphoglycerate dehydrogenase-like enzyme
VTDPPTPPGSGPGPGTGPGGVPHAIALSPILAGRYRAQDLDRIRDAAPGSRLVTLSSDGLADGPVEDVEVLLRGWLRSDAFERLLARAPRLSWVHSATGGVEMALSPSMQAHPFVVTNARGVFSRPIAEYVMLMILAISRRLPELLELQAERTWQPLEGRELRDVTVGVIGLGSIGRTVAELASAFGCRVLATRRNPDRGVAGAGDGTRSAGPGDDALRIDRVLGPDGLHEVLSQADFVVLTAPLTPETENLIDAAALAAMRPDGWLLNVARGRLVDEHELLRSLREGRIGGAVLDTFRHEPQLPDSPFYELPNVIVTPQTSWSSSRVLDRSVELFCDNLRRFAAGQPLRNVVDPLAGY